jgi:hypothetical protein
MRRGAERDMAFAREQAPGGVQPDPARAGHIDFAQACRSQMSCDTPFGPSTATTSGVSWIE